MIAAFQMRNPTVAVSSEDVQTADIYERIVRARRFISTK
jgi:hypothetical protein